jgi:5'-nucleotidase
VTHRPDLMVGGHTHRPVRTRANGIAIMESGAYGQLYSVADLRRVGPDSVHAWLRGPQTPWADLVEPDSAAAALVARYAAEIATRVNAVVAEIAEPLERRGREYGLGRLIADAQREAARAQVAIMNNGGIRSALPAGPVTWGQLQQVQPFANELVRLTLTGRHLRAALEQGVAGRGIHVSGVVLDVDTTRAAGSRIVRLALADGTAVSDDGHYVVAVSDFLAERGDGLLALGEAVSRQDLGLVDLDILIEHLRGLPQPVRAPAEPRIRYVGGTR